MSFKSWQTMSNTVYKSLENLKLDNSCIELISNAAPFRPLPPAFAGSFVDIQFVFDNNVIGSLLY